MLLLYLLPMLLCRSASISVAAYLEVLVCSLLPLLVHRRRWWACEVAGESEKETGSAHAD